jgi:3-phenylpropionate/trans-cinnamate dioxygenase ferredoxin subunit
MSGWVDVCPAAELAPGAHRVIDVDGAKVAVFNLDGELHAIEDVCTHDGGELTGGAIEGEEIVCPRHGARFCIRTGEALSPPAYEPTAKLPVRVENGVVQVCDDRWE